MFLILEVLCIILLVNNLPYQKRKLVNVGNAISGKLFKSKTNFTNYFSLKEENQLMMDHNAMLMSKLYINNDNVTLKDSASSDYRFIPANVINNSLTHVDNYITIDKGENDGIRPEMGVINGSGVVGIVYHTSANYSVVIPILNSKSSVSCKIKRSDYFGFLKWDGGSSEYATVKDMPRHSLFSLGDTIVTSGHSAVFPGGIPIGTVEDMSDSHDGLSYLLKVKLFTDFGRLNDVRVIAQKGLEEQIELEQKVKGGRK